jgi:hypothetical protein
MNNIIGTLLDMQGKINDNFKVCKNLQEMGLREQFHLYMTENGKTYMSIACHTIFDENKINFLQVLKDVRVSDGYASNISRCVRLKECIIAGLKIHDNHILMQQFLPITLCGNLSDNIVRPIVELSAFVQGICSTTLI